MFNSYLVRLINMKVLLFLAAICVLGGNALPPLPALPALPDIPAIPAIPVVSESELVNEILIDGYQIATDMVEMIDGAISLSELQLNQYLAGQDDLTTSLASLPQQFAAANYEEDVVQQCVDEHKDEAVPIHDELRENIRGCVEAARGEVDEVRQNVTYVAMKVQAHGVEAVHAIQKCKDFSHGIPAVTIQCALQKATPEWRKKVAISVRNLGRAVRVGIANVRATAIEGRDCAVTNLVKARDGLTAVAQKVVQCINDKANGK